MLSYHQRLVVEKGLPPSMQLWHNLSPLSMGLGCRILRFCASWNRTSPLISLVQAAKEKRFPPSMLRRRNPTSRKSRGSEVFWKQPTSATSVATRRQSHGCTPVRVTIYLAEIFGTTFGPSIHWRRIGLPRILSTLKPGCF